MSRHEIRKKRLEALYKETITEAVLFKLGDPRLQAGEVAVTKVKISDDFMTANVFFSTDGEQNPNKITKALYSAAPIFFHALKSKVKIKFLPKMEFHFDKELEKAKDVVDLIERLSEEK